jgi:hypothetical protein
VVQGQYFLDSFPHTTIDNRKEKEKEKEKRQSLRARGPHEHHRQKQTISLVSCATRLFYPSALTFAKYDTVMRYTTRFEAS